MLPSVALFKQKTIKAGRPAMAIVTVLLLFACGGGSSDSDNTPNPPASNPPPPPVNDAPSLALRAADISSYPEIRATNPTFYDASGNRRDFLAVLQNSGVNTIRLRLWVTPSNMHSGLAEVTAFATELKAMGFAIWLALHYSDTWADPSQQTLPSIWQGQSNSELAATVYDYTQQVVTAINPQYVQVGNEVNNGFMHPQGQFPSQSPTFKLLLNRAISAVRDHTTAEVMIHFAGIQGAVWFYRQLNDVDFDVIALSYYPIWHGKSLAEVKSTVQQLSSEFNKPVVIAETAYPFTLDYDDFTHNVIGLSSQIIAHYTATPNGQREYMAAVVQLLQETEALGFAYWGGELVAWKGATATDASSWENQALFDFNFRALPILQEFAR